MTQVWFYHLQRQPVERALPVLAQKAAARGWRMVIQTVDDARVRALDDLLWMFDPASFLPHGVAGDARAADQPIIVTAARDNPNGASVRFFVDGAAIANETADEAYDRLILLFDGNDDGALAAARQQWSRFKKEGGDLAYWQQDDRGAWSQRA